MLRKGTECLSLPLSLRTSSSKELKIKHPALSYAVTNNNNNNYYYYYYNTRQHKCDNT